MFSGTTLDGPAIPKRIHVLDAARNSPCPGRGAFFCGHSNCSFQGNGLPAVAPPHPPGSRTPSSKRRTTSTGKLFPSASILSSSAGKLFPSASILSCSAGKLFSSAGILSSSAGKLFPSAGILSARGWRRSTNPPRLRDIFARFTPEMGRRVGNFCRFTPSGPRLNDYLPPPREVGPRLAMTCRGQNRPRPGMVPAPQ